jgi:DNA-binding LacI/PurR family transcriptional regulator
MAERRPVGARVSIVTIEDVAEAAGVSVATVSRALRGLPNVAAETRQRVVKIAERMRYAPDPHASRLAAGETRTIGMAVPFLDRWYFARVVAGVQRFLASVGFDLILYDVGGGEGLRNFIADVMLYRKRTDGLILVDLAMPEDDLGALVSSGLRLALIGRATEHVPSVVIDNYDAAQTMLQHLLSLGHERIGVITGQPEGPMYFDVPGIRLRATVDGLADAGLLLLPELIAEGGFTTRGGHQAMHQLMSLPEPPTAVFAFSDEMAMGALRAAREHGLDVPGDVSVAGFDDHELAWLLDLTTIAQPVLQLGERVARLLLEWLVQPDDAPVHEIVPTELLVRGTTGPPGSQRGGRKPLDDGLDRM